MAKDKHILENINTALSKSGQKAFQGATIGRTVGFITGSAIRHGKAIQAARLATGGLKNIACVFEASAICSKAGSDLSGPFSLTGGFIGGCVGFIEGCRHVDQQLQQFEQSFGQDKK